MHILVERVKKMLQRISSFLILSTLVFSTISFSQDKGEIKVYKNEFWEKIKKSAEEYNEKKEEPKKKFTMDFSGYDLPTSIHEFSQIWHNPPISQGWTGTCWCFSTTSYFESEIYRLTNQKLKLSEMFTVYWEYVEKARRFVRERGDSFFGEGSEANAVMRMWKKYGIVPEKDYPGKPADQEFHDHHLMFAEMNKYLQFVKENNAWNEDDVLTTIKSILNHYLGVPPESISDDGKEMTPKEYFKRVVKLDPDNYINFMSLKEKPYNQFAEYEVEDNWWHSKEYYNLPLNDFMKLLKKSIRDGYGVDLGGDVSESGYDPLKDVAMIPYYDIPSQCIDENARQFRFSNKSTTDDHGIHLVGYMEKDGEDWYLIKDSGSSSRNGANVGYFFYQEDYVKLKMMNIMIPKDYAEKVLVRDIK